MLVRKEEGARVTRLTDIPDGVEESWKKEDNLIGRGGDRATFSFRRFFVIEIGRQTREKEEGGFSMLGS